MKRGRARRIAIRRSKSVPTRAIKPSCYRSGANAIAPRLCNSLKKTLYQDLPNNFRSRLLECATTGVPSELVKERHRSRSFHIKQSDRARPAARRGFVQLSGRSLVPWCNLFARGGLDRLRLAFCYSVSVCERSRLRLAIWCSHQSLSEPRISMQASTHLSQMKTPGPAISLATSLARLPQNEHLSLSSAIMSSGAFQIWCRNLTHSS